MDSARGWNTDACSWGSAYCGDGDDEVRVSATDFRGDDTRAGELNVVDPANAVLSCEKVVDNGVVVVQVPLPVP